MKKAILIGLLGISLTACGKGEVGKMPTLPGSTPEAVHPLFNRPGNDQDVTVCTQEVNKIDDTHEEILPYNESAVRYIVKRYCEIFPGAENCGDPDALVEETYNQYVLTGSVEATEALDLIHAMCTSLTSKGGGF